MMSAYQPADAESKRQLTRLVSPMLNRIGEFS
jgi:hypothetical protein